jgi:hypothetical protein
MSYAPPNQAYRSPYSAYGIDGDKRSVGSLIVLAGSEYADGNTIDLTGTTYELDDDAAVGGGNTPITFTGAETAAEMAALFAAAFDSTSEPGLTVWAEEDALGVWTVQFRVNAPGVEYASTTGGAWPAESVLSGLTGGQLGTGQPARFGPVRAFVPTDGGGRMLG